MTTVLAIEDDPAILRGLADNLRFEGYDVITATDGETGYRLQQERKPDLILLDLMLPRMSGFEFCRKLRGEGIQTPVLMLTARGRPEDVLEGFAAGADDYLPKPFELAILIARLDGLLRRSVWMKQSVALAAGSAEPPAAESKSTESKSEEDTFTFAGKSIDFAELELRSLGNTIHLTVMEAELLRYLVRSGGRIVSRKALLEDVWGLHEDTDTRAIDNFIVRLRKYIEKDPSHPQHLLTVRGVGYRFLPSPAVIAGQE